MSQNKTYNNYKIYEMVKQHTIKKTILKNIFL